MKGSGNGTLGRGGQDKGEGGEVSTRKNAQAPKQPQPKTVCNNLAAVWKPVGQDAGNFSSIVLFLVLTLFSNLQQRIYKDRAPRYFFY